MPIVTLLERQKNNPERVNVYLDGEFAFGLNEMDAVQLHKGQVLSTDDISQLNIKDTVAKAVEKGIALLSLRPRSTYEIRSALAKKQYAPQIIDTAIARLHTLGYLNDEAFARFWVDNRGTFKPLSSKALRYELKQKGIADDIIHSVLEGVADEALAQEAGRAYARRLRHSPPQEFQGRMNQFLQRRGFSYSVAQRATKALLAEIAEQDSTFFQSDDS